MRIFCRTRACDMVSQGWRGALAVAALTAISWSLTAGVSLAADPARSSQRRGDPERIAEKSAVDEPAPADQIRHKLDSAIELAQESRAVLDEVKDYTALFQKSEVVNGRRVEQTMEMKCRHQPFSIYFRFRSQPDADREVIYVDRQYGGNLVVHEAGIKAIAGTLRLRPNDPKVMQENRYPITDVGIRNMLKTALSVWEAERAADPANLDVKLFPNAKLNNSIECQVVQVTHQKQERGLQYHLGRVYFDKKTKLPIRAERFGWPRRQGEEPPLLERYTYTNIKTNVGLNDDDFNPANRRYAYP